MPFGSHFVPTFGFFGSPSQKIAGAKNKNFAKKVGKALQKLDETLYTEHADTAEAAVADARKQALALQGKEFHGFEDNQTAAKKHLHRD